MKDIMEKNNAGKLNLRNLHGHTKIILTNTKTGEQEIVEKDNIVTSFIADVFENNIFGGANYADLTPLRNLFGGVLCFEDELNTNAKLVPSELDNRITAHAGQTSHSSTSTTRGNPNGALSGEIQDGKGYKYVWDFATNQGNGTISSLALCHMWGGDYGLKPIEAIANEYPLVLSSNKSKSLNGTRYNDHYTDQYTCLLKVDLANETGLHAYLNGSTLTITEVAVNFIKQGINNDLGGTTVIDTHDITLTRSFNRQYASVCTDGTYIYVTEPSGENGHTLYMNKIAIGTWTASDVSITNNDMSLGYLRYYRDTVKAVTINRVNVSDGYIYVLASTLRTYYKINLTNTSDVTLLDSLLESDISDALFGLNEISEGVLVGSGYMINGNMVYPTTIPSGLKIAYDYFGYDSNVICRLIRDGSKFYVWTYLYDGTGDYRVNEYNAIGFPAFYLGTIQNLPSPVVKTSDKTMQIQYSLTIASE